MSVVISGPADARVRVTVLAGPEQWVTILDEVYEQPTTSPMTVTDNFTRPSGVGTPFQMQVVNGDTDGSDRITSGTMTIGGAGTGSLSVSDAQKSYAQSITVGQPGTTELRWQ